MKNTINQSNTELTIFITTLVIWALGFTAVIWTMLEGNYYMTF